MNFLLLAIFAACFLVGFFGFDVRRSVRFPCAFVSVVLFLFFLHSLDLSGLPRKSSRANFVERFNSDRDSFRRSFSELLSLARRHRLDELDLRLKHDVELIQLLRRLHGRPIKSLADCGSFSLWHSHLALENDFKCAMAMHVALSENDSFDDLLEYPYLFKTDDEFAFLLRSFVSITNSLHSPYPASFSIKDLSE